MARPPDPEPRPWPQPRPYRPFLWPQDSFEPLPAPADEAGPAIFRVLGERRTIRQFRPLGREALGALLWHSQRRQATALSPLGFELERRPTPSGGAIHPIHTLVFEPQSGRWGRYDTARHGLQGLGALGRTLDDFIDQARVVVPDPSATLIWFVAEPGKTAAKYENPASLVWRDAGVLQGVMVIVAAGLGLGACLLGLNGQAWAEKLSDQRQLEGVGALWVGERP